MGWGASLPAASPLPSSLVQAQSLDVIHPGPGEPIPKQGGLSGIPEGFIAQQLGQV